MRQRTNEPFDELVQAPPLLGGERHNIPQSQPVGLELQSLQRDRVDLVSHEYHRLAG